MKLKRWSQTGITMLAVGMLLMCGTITAQAASFESYPPEGGKWQHGTYSDGGTRWYAYSNYRHDSRRHAAGAWWSGQKQQWSSVMPPRTVASIQVAGVTQGKAGYAVY